jgi:single-strand DNA-binding protein
MNNVVLIGRLVRDVEYRISSSGITVANITVAVDRGYTKEAKAKAELKNEPTADFIRCIAFGKTAEFLSNYFSKGNLIAINGKIQTRNYEDKEGKKVFMTEVLIGNVEKLDWNSYKKEDDNWYTEVDTDEEEIPF